MIARAIATGNFDGCHSGHQELFRVLLHEAAVRNLTPTVISFEPHTRYILGIPGKPALLTTTSEKANFIRSLGIDFQVIPFTRAMAAIPFEIFVREELEKKWNAEFLVFGHDHHFGAEGRGSFDVLLSTFPDLSAMQLSPVYRGGEVVSSSKVRFALESGDVQRANSFLGRSYRIHGLVTEGKRLGHTLGFPTANVQPEPYKLIPKFGVYVGRITLSDGSVHRTVVNIGKQPSIGELPVAIEAHILNFDADIYGQFVNLDLLAFIRAEQKFPSLDALKAQIIADVATAASYPNSVSK